MINHYENFILLLWPDLKSYGVARKDICKKIAGSGDFSIYMEFSVSKKENYVNEKINLLWKLPDVFSISIDPYQYDWENKIHDSHLFFTNYTDGNNELKYEGKDVYFEFDKINKLLITYSANDSAWCASVPLKADSTMKYCVDSAGNKKESNTATCASRVCP